MLVLGKSQHVIDSIEIDNIEKTNALDDKQNTYSERARRDKPGYRRNKPGYRLD